MNLKNLVPPLELCKLIPAGEFADSYFVYMEPDGRTSLTMPHSREYANATVIEWRKTSWILYPAPTLQEILEDGDPIYELHVKHKPGANQSMVSNALKAWLKRNNINYEICLWCGGNMTGDYDNTICSHCGQRTEKVEVIK
jgi:hypothetical protein